MSTENRFAAFTPDERHLITCALAGNDPAQHDHLREPIIRELARADHHHGTCTCIHDGRAQMAALLPHA